MKYESGDIASVAGISNAIRNFRSRKEEPMNLMDLLESTRDHANHMWDKVGEAPLPRDVHESIRTEYEGIKECLTEVVAILNDYEARRLR